MEYCPLGCQRIPLNPFIHPHAVSGNCSDPSELEPLEATWYLVTPSHLPHQPAAWWPLQNTQWSGRKRSPRAWWTGYNERTACERASPPPRSLHSLQAKQRAALEKQRARPRGGSRAFPPQEAARAAASPVPRLLSLWAGLLAWVTEMTEKGLHLRTGERVKKVMLGRVLLSGGQLPHWTELTASLI